MISKKIWDDQAQFNAELRPQLPDSISELNAATKEHTLHLITEVVEMLTAGQVFGVHRRGAIGQVNLENVRRQLIDIQKYWMTIAQAWGFTRAELEATYWAKSATVRQRFAEEWLITLDRPIVILDLDGVLCDYIQGFCRWIVQNARQYASSPDDVKQLIDVAARVARDKIWIDHTTFGLGQHKWNQILHEFRVSGETGRLPIMPFVERFLGWCHRRQMAVVALTSRPIDEYPNLYDDTVRWFATHNLKVDRIWWGSNKAEKLASMIPNLPQVKFAVDDDLKFVTQLSELGVRVYWMTEKENPNNLSNIQIVKRLEEVCIAEKFKEK